MNGPALALLLALALLVGGSILFWPSSGLVSRWLKRRRWSGRILREDALKHIYKTAREGRRPTVQSVAGVLEVTLNKAAEVLTEMERQGLVTYLGGDMHLTPAGEEAAVHIIRAHRLWEQYLAEQTGVQESQWHQLAERQEHLLTPDQANRLSASLGHPARDPHGDPIPARTGELVEPGGRPITTVEPGQLVAIVHIEDEPAAVYARLAAETLRPGMLVRVVERSSQQIRFTADGEEHRLPLMLANNISVAPRLEESDPMADDGTEPLSGLRLGDQGRVVRISRACAGSGRRRLVDLGIVPGTVISAELTSATGDPTAYRVRGAMLALRRDQARQIRIVRLPSPGA